MYAQKTENQTVETAITPVEAQSALKPLLYILVLPLALIALLQWSELPGMLVQALTGH